MKATTISNCEHCGNQYVPTKQSNGKNKQRFCSPYCQVTSFKLKKKERLENESKKNPN